MINVTGSNPTATISANIRPNLLSGHSVNWTINSGDGNVEHVVFGKTTANGDIPVTFPLNGTYSLTVTIDDKNSQTTNISQEFTVNVAVDNDYTITGTVQDDEVGSENVVVTLVWHPNATDEWNIQEVVTDSHGDFSLPGIIVPVTNMSVITARSTE